MDDLDFSVGEGHHPADDKLLHLQLGRSFLAGPHADDSIIKLKWWVRDEDNALIGKVWWGPGAQGPPGHAHGGSQAAILDEACGSACWVAGHPVVAAELTTSFRSPLPLEHMYTVEAWVEHADGRKVFARGHIRDEDGTIFSEATGLFISLTVEQFEAMNQ